MNDLAISVKNVSKNFHYTSGRAGTIKSAFTGAFKSKASKNKDIQHALKNVSFDIKKGEFFGIVGRNGSGKSTLLKMIAGIYQPNAGKITIQGKLVPFIELGVGFNPELTGRENVYLNGALLGFSRKEIEAQYADIVEFAELEKFMDQQLKNYSSGMQVRLAFSMAVRAKADILLIDEVLAVGDADFQRKCFDYFKQLKKNKKTVVFVSHDMEAVRQYCDRAVLIESSRLIMDGSPDKIAQQYIRQFNAETRDKITNEDISTESTKRWGDKSIVTSQVSSKVEGSKISISQLVTANSNVDNYILGIRIKTASGEHLTGINTKILKQNLPELLQGEQISVDWEFDNIFSDGEYFIDTSISKDDEVSVYDWWNDACKITVLRDRHVPYSVDLDFIARVEKI